MRAEGGKKGKGKRREKKRKKEEKMGIVVFLAHLSRRLTGELIVYRGIRRPSVVRQHFQTTSPLKPLGGFFPYYTYSIYR